MKPPGTTGRVPSAVIQQHATTKGSPVTTDSDESSRNRKSSPASLVAGKRPITHREEKRREESAFITFPCSRAGHRPDLASSRSCARPVAPIRLAAWGSVHHGFRVGRIPQLSTAGTPNHAERPTRHRSTPGDVSLGGRRARDGRPACARPEGVLRPSLHWDYGRWRLASPRASLLASSHESSTIPRCGSARRRIRVKPSGPAMNGF